MLFCSVKIRKFSVLCFFGQICFRCWQIGFKCACFVCLNWIDVNGVAIKREFFIMNDIEKCIFLEVGINLDNNINIGGINLFKSTGT